MSISKISSASFKGYLEILHKNGSQCFDAKDIKKVIINDSKGFLLIEGNEIESGYTRIYVPCDTFIQQDKIVEAYRTARTSDNDKTVTLKINKICKVEYPKSLKIKK